MNLKNNEICFQLNMFLFPCICILGTHSRTQFPTPFKTMKTTMTTSKIKKHKPFTIQIGAPHNIWLSQVHKSMMLKWLWFEKKILFEYKRKSCIDLLFLPICIRYSFPSNHNIHKSLHGLCFKVSDPLIGRF